MFEEFEAFLQKHNIDPSCASGVGNGWVPILNRLMFDLKLLGWKGQVWQIKEKFGVLRIYLSDTTDEIYELLYRVEQESAVTCEECGNPGGLREDRNWLYTSCEEHVRRPK